MRPAKSPSHRICTDTDPHNRLPVLGVLVVRVAGPLVLQVGLVVVVAVLVDLIQTPDEMKKVDM